MSVWKHGKFWWVDFIVNGRRVQCSTGTSNRRQADLIFHKMKLDANNAHQGVVQVDPHMTVAALTARFLTSSAARQHHTDRLKFLLPFFGAIPVLKITKGLAEEYRHQRKLDKPVSDATVNRDLSTFKKLLYWGMDQGLLATNPLARLRMVSEPRIFRKIVSVSEEERLLKAAPEHLREIDIVALDTGMRRGEITSQLWQDLDLGRRLIHATKSKTIAGQLREIPMTRRVYEMLLARSEDEGLVFTYKGRSVRILKTAWKATLRRAGLRHFRFHDLRHTFASRLMEAGVSQDVRMALMGHTGGDRVHSTYIHVELPAKRRAIAKLEEWIREQKQFDCQGGIDHGDTKTA